ncbi:acyltransferase family protein [Novosphingobium lentum]|uniref:acyltransferase family protein n=1 Tax=Novosphingobium lentum TaxID=145287 RepID=UPI0008352CCE|nr:acyltransferase [Novosphingobium lentum]
MTLKNALDQNRGIGPGFHFLRHALSIAIVLFHCRQVVYWAHSADLLAAAGITNAGAAGAAAEASQAGPVHFTLQEMIRPAFHSMVGLFFALSGFLIAGSALRTGSIPKFFANRVLRIFPALSVETLLSAFILGPLVTALPLGAYFTDPEFFRYFGNIVGWVYFYLPGVFLNNPDPRVVNGQLWTLPSEFYCYLIMLVCLATGIINRRNLFLGIGIAGVILMVVLFYHDPVHYNPKHQNFFTPWYIVVIFWFGVIFFLHADKVKLRLWMFLASIVIYWAIVFFGVLTPLAGIFLTYCMVYIGFVRFPWWDRLVKSDYSYGLFLYHFPILQAYMYFLGPVFKGVPLIVQFVTIVVLGLSTTLAFAAASWRFIEKPALSLRTVFAKTKPVVEEAEPKATIAPSGIIAVAPAD